MRNDTDLVQVYPSLQHPDGSTVVLAPGEEFDEKSAAGSVPAAASSVAAGPADPTPTAEPAASSETPAPPAAPAAETPAA